MADNPYVKRVRGLTFEITEQNALLRETVVKALEVLRAPLPDTFLGRKTQEPFAKEEE